VDRDRLRYNQFGGSIGGLVRKGKTCFFFNNEEYRDREGAPKTTTVPVERERERQGDFSNTQDIKGALIPIYDPATAHPNPGGSGALRSVFPNNVISQSRLDPAAQKGLGLIPLPNRTPSDPFTNSKHYQTQTVHTTESEQYHARVDQRFGDNNSLFVRFSDFAHRPFQKQVIFPGDMYGRKDDRTRISWSPTRIRSRLRC
jgi:hypothetical protein